MSAYRGSCHCGAVGYEFRTELPPPAWSVRACQCSFCLKHAGVYTSDPRGSVRFTVKDPAFLARYRFGHKTADFVFCTRCGGYLGAITEEDGNKLAVLNIHAMDPMPAGLPAGQPTSYEGETTDDRNSRRSQRWTPVVS
ncbi:MAG: GFA family protein [Gammaproteobacteria bacterium]